MRTTTTAAPGDLEHLHDALTDYGVDHWTEPGMVIVPADTRTYVATVQYANPALPLRVTVHDGPTDAPVVREYGRTASTVAVELASVAACRDTRPTPVAAAVAAYTTCPTPAAGRHLRAVTGTPEPLTLTRRGRVARDLATLTAGGLGVAAAAGILRMVAGS